MEYKASPFFIKRIEDRTVVGITAVMGNVDDGGDCGHMGMFAKTIQERASRVKHLWQHDMWQPPIAAIKQLREVGRDELPAELLEKAPAAEGGLEVTREYLDTERGNEVLAGIKAGAINEMSYGYDAMKWDYEEVKNEAGRSMTIRHLREVRLWDTSDVNWGMNPATVAASKGINPYLLNLVALSRSVVDDTDALKAGRVLSARNLERLKEALGVLSDILTAAEPSTEEEDEDSSGKTLTAWAEVQTRLAIAERELYLIDTER